MKLFLRWTKHQWDRTAALVAAGVGLVLLTVGWFGVSRQSLPSEQIPYLASGAVFGLFALGVAATLWLSADLRDQWRKLHDIHKTMEATLDLQKAASERDPVVAARR